MPRYGRAALATAAGGLLSLGVLAGLMVAPLPANAATSSYRCEIPTTTGQPDCTINVLAVAKPLSFGLQIVSLPEKQPVWYNWTVICKVNGTYTGTHDTETEFTPLSLSLPVTVADPDSCQLTIIVEQVGDSTGITATLTATSAASPSPSPSPTATPTGSPAPPVVRGFGGKCAGTPGSSAAKRTKVEIRACSATSPAETWKFRGGELIHDNMCANARGPVAKGSKVILWPCNGSANEIWTHKSNGEYVLKAGHGQLCLDDPHSAIANGTQLMVYTCTNSRNQHWTLPGH
jgi:Ricin-type beta-trefoil lectin domain